MRYAIGNDYDGGDRGRGPLNALGVNIVDSPDTNPRSDIVDGIKGHLYNALKQAAAPAGSHSIRKQIPRADRPTIRAACKFASDLSDGLTLVLP